MSTKELGTIKDARVYVEHRDILTSYITIDFDSGGTQGFGGLNLGNKKIAKSYTDDICKAFGVKNLEDIVGMKCYALRNFSTWNEIICGLETLDGKRFTHYAWRKKMFPEHTKHPLAEKLESLNDDLEYFKKKIEQTELEIAGISEKFVDWG